MQEQGKLFTVAVIEAKDRKTGQGIIVYEGDDAREARAAMDQERAKPENKGRYLRLYNFALFGGGIQDTLI